VLPLCASLATALVFSTTAQAAKAPVVKSVSPMNVSVGEKLTIKGRNFVPGKGKTKVFFVRVKGKGVATAAASRASRTKVVVVVPVTLNDALAGEKARFRLRVLGKKFGKWTPTGNSPVVASVSDAGGPGSGGGGSNPEADCDADGTPNGTDSDDDNDFLSDTQESQFGTVPCNADTDGDTVIDGYEHTSALDLNRSGGSPSTPYPSKRPYPNPLFPDAGTDYDGDGLTLSDEQLLWVKYGNRQMPLNYSDGNQTTEYTPAPAAVELDQLNTASWHDDGELNDGERDADRDGLGNWDESHGRMTPSWWPETFDGDPYPKEKPYPLVSYAGTSFDDPDSDGDGVLDGADDVDHDGLANYYEVARPYDWFTTYVSAGHTGAPAPNPWARTDPFNPCKPVFSATCHQHPPFGYYSAEEDWEGPTVVEANAVRPAGDKPGVLRAP
jgi:hypothetical protein